MINQDFPILLPHQVALARAERASGHVLDEQFRLAINKDQIVYTIFDSAETAIDYAKRILEANAAVECLIFDSSQEVIFYAPS